MKFYEVQPALEAGKKIRRKSMYENVLGISLSKCLRNVYVEVFADGSESIWEMNSHDLRADDWEIIGDSKTESKMDFSDALKALKQGKKVRRKSIPVDEYLEIGYPIPGDPVIYVKLSGSSVMFTPTQGHLFAKDWEIVTTSKVPVKTKTIEYINCSTCGKEIEVRNMNTRAICECKNEMVLGRESESTVEEAKCILDLANFFNIMYFPML